MRILALIGVLAIIIGAVVAAYVFAGFYNVAASEEDAGPIGSALVWVRNASISRHAADKAPIALDDPAAIREGARRYAQYGCVHCHGAPGAEWSKFSEGLNPGPPDLNDTAKGRDPAAIFWVIKNGIRMTGMPSFAKAGVPDNEIWQIVAFVKGLPKATAADYKSWTTAPPAQ